MPEDPRQEENKVTEDEHNTALSENEIKSPSGSSHRMSVRNRNIAVIASVAIVVLLVIAVLAWRQRSAVSPTGEANAKDPHSEERAGEGTQEVKLSPQALDAAKIEIEGVTQRPAVALLNVTGTVEANQQQTQSVTPLVGGRVESVNVVLGTRVSAGAVLALISSPQIAQMHGKLHEAETTLALARRNLARVQRSENRVAVLQAKARLDEAESTLRRTKRLIELGAGAGKDLIAAETVYKTAKADYDFQNNISLNRELQEAEAAVETARVDVSHIRDEMRSLGAPVPEGERDDHTKNTSLIALRAPVAGTVTERLINAGAGVEAGQSLLTISNLSTVWIIANVPEASIGNVRVGTTAEVRSVALASNVIAGSVSYINPQLNEETRTAQVRIAVPNAGERLKAGMFVEVGLQSGTGQATGEEPMVSSEAVQKVGQRTVVFIPKDDEPGHFEVREVQLGGESAGYRKVLSGLSLGEKVVTKGSFLLKSQMMKGEMGGDDH